MSALVDEWCSESEGVSEGVGARYEPELKSCGHSCCPSTVPMCCACSDVRPVLEGDTYPCYEDGVGWRNTDARDSGYCPVCNPKNYEAWERRIRLERERKRVIKEEQALREKQILLVQENDRVRAAALAKVDSTTHTQPQLEFQSVMSTASTEFTYSNGDSYKGEMADGQPHGSGVMIYACGEEYTGCWLHGKHHGQGTKSWGDGIVYRGEWQDDMMHGSGHYIMADGTEVIGTFAEDEFVE